MVRPPTSHSMHKTYESPDLTRSSATSSSSSTKASFLDTFNEKQTLFDYFDFRSSFDASCFINRDIVNSFTSNMDIYLSYLAP